MLRFLVFRYFFIKMIGFDRIVKVKRVYGIISEGIENVNSGI